jgi:hypothetical protein
LKKRGIEMLADSAVQQNAEAQGGRRSGVLNRRKRREQRRVFGQD